MPLSPIAIALLILVACTGRPSDIPNATADLEPLDVELAISRTLLLRADALRPIVTPLRVDVAPDGSYYIADRSERALWVYDSSGYPAGQIAGAGYGEGRLQTLYGAALIRDTVVLYDFNTASLSLFEQNGKFITAVPVATRARDRPRRVSPIGDSLLLFSRFPSRSDKRPLLAIARADGREIASIGFASDYYDRNPTLFTALTQPIADASDGVIVAGVTGHDSLTVFDYAGVRIVEARIELAKGPRVTDYETIAATRVGSLGVGDLPAIADSLREAYSFGLSRIVVVNSSHAVIELRLPERAQSDASISPDSVWLVPVAWDGGSKRMLFGDPMQVAGRLLGRASNGRALVLNVGRPDGNAVLVELTIQRAASAGWQL